MLELLDWALLTSAVLFAAPLILAALGECVAERAGVINIGVEGLMLTGAMAAWLADTRLGPGPALAVAAGAAMALALVFALATLRFGADQIVTGAGINLAALGLTELLDRRYGQAAATDAAAIAPLWLAAFAVLVAAALHILFRFTRQGMELTAIGESPKAAQSAGIAVNRRKLLAVLFGAACAGVAGAYFSTMRVRAFTPNTTDGAGFLALAIVIFGRWHPLGILLAGLLFGLAMALADRLAILPAFQNVEGLLKMLPYVVSLAALAGVGGKSRSPAALGQPFMA